MIVHLREHEVRVVGPGILDRFAGVVIDHGPARLSHVEGVGLEDRGHILHNGEVAEPVGFGAGDGAALRLRIVEVLANVGDVLVNAVVPEDHVLRIEVVALGHRAIVEDRPVGDLPVDPVAGGEDVNARPEGVEVAHHAESLLRRRRRIEEDHHAVLPDLQTRGPVTDHDVVVPATGVLDQAESGLLPMDAVLRAGVADGPGLPGAVPLLVVHRVIPEVIRLALLEDAAVRADAARLPGTVGLDGPLAGLAGRVDAQINVFAFRKETAVDEELAPVAHIPRAVGPGRTRGLRPDRRRKTANQNRGENRQGSSCARADLCSHGNSSCSSSTERRVPRSVPFAVRRFHVRRAPTARSPRRGRKRTKLTNQERP